jgi:hypothetical protein
LSLLQDKQLSQSRHRKRYQRVSLGVAACVKPYVPIRPRLFGFTVGRSDAPVSMHILTIGSSTVPESYGYVSVHSSFRQTLLQSSFSSAPAGFFRIGNYLLGFMPSSRHHCIAPTNVKFPSSTGVVPSVLNCSTTFCNTTCELISSRSRVQDSVSFRGLHSLRSVRSSSD